MKSGKRPSIILARFADLENNHALSARVIFDKEENNIEGPFYAPMARKKSSLRRRDTLINELSDMTA